MTIDNKILLIRFIARPGMFGLSIDKNSFVSFITGYEMGSSTCDFSEPLEKFISDKFDIPLNSSRWIGQIELLSQKLSLNWVTTFRKISLELLINNSLADLHDELNKTLKTRINNLISRIKIGGDPWFNETWREEWLSLSSSTSEWFKQIWTNDEWIVIQAINKTVHADKIFEDKENKLPTRELIRLKDQYDCLT